MTGAAFAVAALVGLLFAVAAIEDARTGRVTVRLGQLATAVAIGGLGLVGVITAGWSELARAAAGGVLVTVIQAVPYLLQPGRRGAGSGQWIGRADVRFGVPFGWTLGWFGLGFVVIGYGVALLAGLAATGLARRRQIPFVPFLTIGLWVGLAWALARSLTT